MPFSKNYNSTNTKFEPPAPLVEVNLFTPGNAPSKTISVDALIDSGADISVIPRKYVNELKLRPVDSLPAIGYEGIEKTEMVYSVRISIPGVGDYIDRVISSNDECVLLGRDIINHWELFLNGKSKVFQIS